MPVWKAETDQYQFHNKTKQPKVIKSIRYESETEPGKKQNENRNQNNVYPEEAPCKDDNFPYKHPNQI